MRKITTVTQTRFLLLTVCYQVGFRKYHIANGVASFITTDEQLQLNRGCRFLVQAMFHEGFPFHQFIINYLTYFNMLC